MDIRQPDIICPRCNTKFSFFVNFCSNCGWYVRAPYNYHAKVVYDIENGIYPAGQYMAGRDLLPGGYILTPITSNKESQLLIYKNYNSFLNEDEISWHTFYEPYHIVVADNKSIIVVENAYLKKIS